MIAFIKTLARVASAKPMEVKSTEVKSPEVKPAALRALSLQETEIVSGGLNPQPLPPRRVQF